MTGDQEEDYGFDLISTPSLPAAETKICIFLSVVDPDAEIFVPDQDSARMEEQIIGRFSFLIDYKVFL